MPSAHLSGFRVLVTGGAGFIGSHIVDLLVDRGASVRILDNFSTGTLENLAHVSNRIDVVQGDICDSEVCRHATAQMDYVLHQAAACSIQDSLQNPAKTIAINVSGTANILQAARDAGIKRVVYASSASVYGVHAPQHSEIASAGTASSAYGLSKAMAELLADLFSARYGMEVIGLRYFNVYGPRQAPGAAHAPVVPRFFAAFARHKALTIYGTGEQTRDFVFVRDVAEANLAALVPKQLETAVYDVGTGKSTTVGQLAEAISVLVGARHSVGYAPVRDGDIPHSLADPSHLEKALGYRPQTGLLEGLHVTSDYYQAIGPVLYSE